jgi:competence protein ComEC
VIVRLAAGRRRVLLTGDIEREAERVLVEQERERLAADVLKVAHHGSRSSTTPAFLETVRPLRGVVSCGVSNRFGHPHAETEESLERARVRIDRTSVAGNLRFRFDGSRIFVQREFDSGRP